MRRPPRKKYRPNRAEQGIYSVRRIGEELPTKSPEQIQREREAARTWGMVSDVPNWLFVEGLSGVQKRNFRGSDIAKRGHYRP